MRWLCRGYEVDISYGFPIWQVALSRELVASLVVLLFAGFRSVQTVLFVPGFTSRGGLFRGLAAADLCAVVPGVQLGLTCCWVRLVNYGSDKLYPGRAVSELPFEQVSFWPFEFDLTKTLGLLVVGRSCSRNAA